MISITALLFAGGSIRGAVVLKQDKDLKSGVGYTVVLDDQSVTLAFDFSGPMRLMQLARNGFSVYVNEKGKKSGDVGLIVSGIRPPQPPERRELPQGEDKDHKSKTGTPGDVVFEQAFWKKGSDSIFLDLTNETTGFKVYLDCTDDKYRCVVVIPSGSVNPAGIGKPEKMMIGLLSENTIAGPPAGIPSKRSESEGDSGFGSMEGGPGGTMPAGGMPGGGMGMSGGGMGRPGGGPGGPGGGRPGGPPPGGMGEPNQSASNEIKLWFKCK